jgi:predicted HTH domain antitoxin
MKTQILSTRVEETFAAEIQQLANEEGLDKSSFLKKIILSGLQEYKIGHAVALFNKKKITLSRAAELADITVYELISLMPDYTMELHYSPTDFQNDMELEL